MDYKVKETQKVYHGSRITVYRDFVEQPDGSEVTREVVAFNNAAAIVPLTSRGEVILIRQFRYPTKGALLEIPAGVLEEGEKPEDCARREVEEETGYRPGRLTWLGKIHTSPGVCTEAIDIYLAEDLESGDQNLDHGEVIEPCVVKFEEALSMIAEGEITDAKTICGLLLARRVLRLRQSDTILEEGLACPPDTP
jgi:ADP-ribose pyrophosphatase